MAQNRSHASREIAAAYADTELPDSPD